MSDWTLGYVVDRDVGYTYGYYTELNPLRARPAFLGSSLVPPAIETACELGFGQGLSTNIHAAASGVSWWGTDFNPSQAAFARELAQVSGAPARLFDESFAQFCARGDLPDFDYIGLHGIWSWISDQNRQLLVDFVGRKLKVGGVLYISYNTMPGWAAFAPMRYLLSEHAEVMAAPGRGLIPRIDAALQFAQDLVATNPRYVAASPQVAERINMIKGQNRHYVAHEFFNRDWAPMLFADMAKWLSPAKLDYACSAHYLDHIEAINLTPDQRTFLRSIPERMFRESTRDFMTNQQFRRDYWVRGVRALSPIAQLEALRAERFVLLTPAADVPFKANGTLGEAVLQEAVYRPVIEQLADHRARSIGEVERALEGKDITLAQVLEVMVVLTGAGHVASVQPSAQAARAKPHVARLNAHLMQLARGSSDISYLASPVTGGGVLVNAVEQLFLLARGEGRTQPQDWALSCWQALQAQGRRLVRDGKPIESDDENVAELTREAKSFAEKRLPVLKALEIA